MTDLGGSPPPIIVRLDPYSYSTPRFLVVVDSNALLSSVDNDCRHDRQSRLLRMTAHDTAFLYAPDHVYFEVYDRLSKLAATSPVPLDELRRRFEEYYLPRLRFITVSGDVGCDPQIAAITDADDVPTGRLAKLIAPCIVISEDKHLRLPGLAPAKWREVAGAGVDLAESYGKQVAAVLPVVLPARLATASVRFVSRKIGVTAWMLGSAVSLAGAIALVKPERRTIALQMLRLLAEQIAEAAGEARQLEWRGIKALQKVILEQPENPTVKQQVSIVLSRRDQPLLAREVQEAIDLQFSDLAPTLREVRAVLDDGSEFVRVDRYRWQFGGWAAPMQ